MRRTIALAFAFLFSISCVCAQDKPTPLPAPIPPPAAKAEDVASPDAIIAALYDVISGPAGQKRDWDRMRSLFAPGARLIPTRRNPQSGEVQPVTLDVEGYITRSAPMLEQNGFFEKEIARSTARFGNILHAFSTYESRHKADDTLPFTRGINSIQLCFDGKRWWVVTVYWQAESAGTPLPKEFLPSAKP